MNINKDRYQKLYGSPIGSNNDYYLQRFPDKPKSEIAQYIASQGIPTPQIFNSLEHARTSGVDFIIRSEHPIEYYGAAGLFDSVVINDRKKAYAQSLLDGLSCTVDPQVAKQLPSYKARELESILINQIQHLSGSYLEECLQAIEYDNARRYSQLIDTNTEEFAAGLGYSYRQLLDGYNRSMIEDSAISGRYHLFTQRIKPSGRKYLNYSIVQANNGIIFSGPFPLEDQLISHIHKDIAFYEQIRTLSRFDKNHCPIIEFQTTNNKNYFLQYHRTRNKDVSDFVLDAEPTTHQIKALFCRGKTSQEGMVINAQVYFENHFQKPLVLPIKQEGAFDLHDHQLFTEVMTRRRTVQFYNGHQDMNFFAAKALTQHVPKSMLFNPEISLVLLEREMEPYVKGLYKRYKQNGYSLSLPMHIVADGTTAYAQFLE